MVSGDFYWVDSIKNPHTAQTINILAVVDCTGHGIPGAFMALIGTTLLNKIIKTGKIVDPATILYRLHQEVRALLRQDKSNNNYGMDLGILTWETKDNEKFKCTFAGAKRPLLYLDQHSEAMHIIKGERRAIGGIQNEKKAFINQEIDLHKGSTLYLSTDGYADQNDLQRKRIGEKKFMEVLKSNAKLPMNIQKYHLEVTLAQQMLGTTQRDDILTIGFRL